jgi:DnaJ-class molecular chaperone
MTFRAKEQILETIPSSFIKLFESYFDTSYLFMKLLLPGPALPHEQDKGVRQRDIPPHLRAEYALLHLQAGASLVEVRTQYRELAKLYHPDAGGHHTYFLALQQAYEVVIEYLQTHQQKTM